MTRKFVKSKKFSFVAAALFSLTLGAACGDDDGGNNTPDAGDEPDAETPDAALVYGDDFKYAPAALSDGDGGEIRIENLIFPQNVSRTLVTAHFFDDQNGQMAFPNVVEAEADTNINLNCNFVGGTQGKSAVPGEEALDVGTTNADPDEIYPFGDASAEIGSVASFAPGGRNYLDIGDKVTLQGEGKDAFDLVRYENHITPFTGGHFHDIVYDPAPSDDPTLAVPAERMGGQDGNSGGTELTVTFSGSDEVTATEWAFEEVDGTAFAGVEIPPRPIVSQVNDADILFSGSADGMSNQASTIVLPATGDMKIEYSYGEGKADLLGFVAIFQHEPVFEITHLCVHTGPAAQAAANSTNDITLTIPRATIDEMAPFGTLFVAHLYHRVRTLTGDRRVDNVGTACTATIFKKPDFTGDMTNRTPVDEADFQTVPSI